MSALLAVLLGLQTVPVPDAVIADPPRDAAHPARNEQLLVPSHGAGMNAVLLHASGAGPHPLVVLFHGLPGNERNLDLAQAMRRAGWSVLTLSYRGAFGSPGDFSVAHAVEDGDATVAFLRSPGIAQRYAIDPARIVLAGHSMGGFVSAMHVAHDPTIAGLVLIDAWNVGAAGAAARAGKASEATVAAGFDDLGHLLVGATAWTLAAETLGAGDDWRLERKAPALAKVPVLVLGAQFGGGKENAALAEAITRAGGRVSATTMESDHSFADHRIALAAEVVRWLQGLK